MKLFFESSILMLFFTPMVFANIQESLDQKLQNAVGNYVLTKELSDPECVKMFSNPTKYPLVVSLNKQWPDIIEFDFLDEHGRNGTRISFSKVNKGVQNVRRPMDEYKESRKGSWETSWDGSSLKYDSNINHCWLFICERFKDKFEVVIADENNLIWKGMIPLDQKKLLKKGCFFERW